MMKRIFLPMAIIAMSATGCQVTPPTSEPVRLVVLDPGHFHAALLQKSRIEALSDTVRVYAPAGAEVEQYLAQIEAYNQREEAPTAWVEEAYIGDDYLERMREEQAGDVVVLAGNNRLKAEYVSKAVEAGFNVLSDKPMAITEEDFAKLEAACNTAADAGLAVRDMMTERHDLLNIVTREIIADTALFGTLQTGSAEAPAVKMRSVHHFYKEVSGNPLKRPAWYYDVRQQGEGIADVTTHLIDLFFWQCFPEEAIRYQEDVEVVAASHYPTPISMEQYTRSTGCTEWPDYLQDVVKNNVAQVMSNGSMCFSTKGVYVTMEVLWNYEAPVGGGDTFSATMTGSRATIQVVQDATTGYVKELYLVPTAEEDLTEAAAAFEARMQAEHPYLRITDEENRLHVELPVEFRLGHETHFGLVGEAFLREVRGEATAPEWERTNLLAKYYITTRAAALAAE